MKTNKSTFYSGLAALLLFVQCGSAELPFFDGGNAFSYLTAQTDFGPRNPGSEGHQKTLSFLSTELAKFADTVKLQPFAFTDSIKDTSFTMTNIIAAFNVNSTDRILLTAHWDTRPFADRDPDPDKKLLPLLGANDGASGVAVLLQIAKILKENPPPIGVDIVLFDGEDYGEEGNLDYYFLGARHFTEAAKAGGYNPRYGILLDMVGDKDQRFPFEGFSMQYAANVTRTVWSRAKKLGLDVFVEEMGPSVSDDHLILNQAGIPTVDIIDFDYPYWHTAEDTPDKCSPESLARVGQLLVSLIYD